MMAVALICHYSV